MYQKPCGMVLNIPPIPLKLIAANLDMLFKVQIERSQPQYFIPSVYKWIFYKIGYSCIGIKDSDTGVEPFPRFDADREVDFGLNVNILGHIRLYKL